MGLAGRSLACFNVITRYYVISLFDMKRLPTRSPECRERGLDSLVGHLGVLNERGVLLATSGEPVADGLRFLGFLPRPSQLGYSAKRSRLIARQIAHDLR